MKIEIDVDEFAEKIKAGKGLSGKDGALTSLVKQITEMTLQAELESHLAQDLQKNRKNGYTSKTMKTEHGAFELATPRDRNGSFEPQIVKKNQTHLSDEIEKKMLSLFSLGNSYAQITEHIEDIYGVSFSKPAITAVTDKLIPMLEEWRVRPLEAIYPFIYLDAIHSDKVLLVKATPKRRISQPQLQVFSSSLRSCSTLTCGRDSGGVVLPPRFLRTVGTCSTSVSSSIGRVSEARASKREGWSEEDFSEEAVNL